MASFTDAISQFNPYVQQLPTELMAKVGMQKQAQYEAGVQKIQTYIDNIAGMDVMKDVDKQYLKSKMDTLGNNLKVVAGGDFSNQQLVNSVAGMATEIGKDPIVQNAVSSTAWYRKQEQELQRQYKEGKSSIANVQDFYDQAKGWLSSTTPGETFRGTYSPYRDMQKKFMEVIKSINPSASSEDFAYTQFIDKDGKLRTGDIAQAMTRVTKEGVDRATIENAIRASLTPDDLNQLRIDANYRFRDITDPDQFKSALSAGYDKQIKQLDSQKAALETILNASGNDFDKMKARTSIASIDDAKLKLKNTLEERMSLADQNLQAAKLDLYKDESIFQTANAFSWEKKATQLLTNPVLQAQIDVKNLELSQAKFREDVAMNSWKKYMDVEGLKIDKAKLDIEFEKLYGKDSGFTTYVGEPTKNLASPELVIENNISKFKQQEADGLSVLASSLNTDQAKAKLILENYKKNPNSLDSRLWSTADRILTSQYEQNVLTNQLRRAERDALAKNPTLANEKLEIDAAIRDGKPLTIVGADGVRNTFTPMELFNFSSKKARIGRKPGETITMASPAISIDLSELSAKERRLYDAMMRGSSRDKIVNATSMYDRVAEQHRLFQSKLKNETSTVLAESSGKYIPAVSLIETPNPETKAKYAGIADVAATKYLSEKLGIKGGSAMLSPEEAKTVKAWVTGEDKNNLIFKKLNYGGEQHLIVTNKGEDIIIPLSSEEVGQMPTLRGESKAFNESIYEIQRANGPSLSTNPTGNVEDARYQKWKMPNVKNTIVYGDLQADPEIPKDQYININVRGKNGQLYPVTVNPGKPMSAEAADGFLRSLTDNKLREIYMTSPSWKNQIDNIF